MKIDTIKENENRYDKGKWKMKKILRNWRVIRGDKEIKNTYKYQDLGWLSILKVTTQLAQLCHKTLEVISTAKMSKCQYKYINCYKTLEGISTANSRIMYIINNKLWYMY